MTPILKEPELVKVVRASGLLLGTYGSENNDLRTIEQQEAAQVDLVVSDHITRARRARSAVPSPVTSAD